MLFTFKIGDKNEEIYHPVPNHQKLDNALCCNTFEANTLAIPAQRPEEAPLINATSAIPLSETLFYKHQLTSMIPHIGLQ